VTTVKNKQGGSTVFCLNAALLLQPCSGLMCLRSSYIHEHKYHSQPLISDII